MENKIEVTLKGLLSQDNVKARFMDVLGNRANAFISSLISVANNNTMLQKANPQSIMQAGVMAATLDLPINQNLGFAYIIPYNCKNKEGNYEVQAQFQIGYKGILQLAQRSGQFKTINVTDVKEGEIKHINRETGEIEYDWIQEGRDSKKTIGFLAYFELINGFRKSFYMSVETLRGHGLKYSKTYSNEKTKKTSLWETDFDTMASKTVLKLLLSKYAPLSIQMQNAIIADQGIIKETTPTIDVDYTDNTPATISDINDEKEQTRIAEFIQSAKTIKQLKEVEPLIKQYDLVADYEIKKEELTNLKLL